MNGDVDSPTVGLVVHFSSTLCRYPCLQY